MGRVEHGYKVRPDLCATDCKTSPRQFLGQFYTDALVHDPVALKLLVDVIGEVWTYIVFFLMDFIHVYDINICMKNLVEWSN